MTNDRLSELLSVERRGWQSLCDGTGEAFYGELMTDDAVMILANGEVMDRDTVVSALGQSPPWGSYDIEQARVVDLGDDAAVLVYRGVARREGPEPVFTGAMSSVYVRRDGEWRLVLYQQTEKATTTG